MSQYSLEQSLSALMDGEADELEVQRILRESDNPLLRARWQRLQLLRSAMRQEPVVAGIDLSAGIRQALDGVRMDEVRATQATQTVNASPWLRWSKLAVAASVTLAVLAGARFYNDTSVPQAGPVMASTAGHVAPPVPQSSAGPVVLASYGGPEQRGQVQQQPQLRDDSSLWYSERLPAYLQQHNQQTTASGMDAGLPYARSASIKGQ